MGVKVVGGLKYDDTIFYEEDGSKYKMIVHIRMNDECKNKICEFAITADIYELHGSNWVHFIGGCCHDCILKYAPQYKCFVDLHLCNNYGYHTYVIENTIYFFKCKQYDSIKSYLRLKNEELEQILLVVDDVKALQWKLKDLGVIDRWYQEALEAIEYLDELTGSRWINPYSNSEERFVIKPLTDDENILISKRMNEGYYSKQAVEKRRKKAFNDKIQKQKEEAYNKFEVETIDRKQRLDIKLSILEEGILIDNVIIYDHCKEVSFNLKSYGEKVERQDYDRYVSRMKSECRFEDWKFIFVEN